ncbi:MAG: cysteine--tRNA ligase [Clostridia bacterium]|nr:cysteine--tRNA ligase [Clostridia bacterium]
MKLYNSMTRKKEEFVPINQGEVLMYSCGPTVYNFFHLGNARPFIIFDTLRRYFEYKGYDVKFVQNFTDVDDKMIKNANEQGITVGQLAEKFINEYFVDAKGLGIKEATVHPRATENIDAIIELISTLIEKGYAYEADGDVYFRTLKFKEYGKLSHQPLDDLKLGARIDVGDKKEDPMDFALWKAKKEGEIAWKCPWGEGRPGWHIECSAMANKYLGKTIDIHSGGKDLIFPHHENEIAQSETANGQPFANYWLHNGFINVNNEKMSKSLGNFFTIRDISKKYDYEVIRFFMLSAHYRSPINFSDELMEQAKSALERLYTCIKTLDFMIESASDGGLEHGEQEILSKVKEYKTKFLDAMEDDLNTADAISVLFEIVKEINVNIKNDGEYTKELLVSCKDFLKELGGVLGLLQKEEKEEIDSGLQELIDARTQARKDKNWAEADRIRDLLKEKGIELKDTPSGVQIIYTK